jgi:phage baseplate assembly protein W
MAVVDKRANQFIEDKDSRVKVGISLPFSNKTRGDGYFDSSKTTLDAVKNNIKMLLNTDKGERVFQPNLGISVKEFLFQPMDEDIRIQIENSIVEALELWMPFVELLDIQMVESGNQLNVQLKFNISKSANYLSNSDDAETVNLTFNRE